MNLIATGVIILMGFGARYVLDISSELSAELSASVLMDAEPGIETAGSLVTADAIVDMRPETAIIGEAASDLPDVVSQAP